MDCSVERTCVIVHHKPMKVSGSPANGTILESFFGRVLWILAPPWEEYCSLALLVN